MDSVNRERVAGVQGGMPRAAPPLRVSLAAFVAVAGLGCAPAAGASGGGGRVDGAASHAVDDGGVDKDGAVDEDGVVDKDGAVDDGAAAPRRRTRRADADAAFAAFVDPAARYADGFAAPLGAGWRPAADRVWTASTPHEVRAMARGTAAVAADGTVRVTHRWIDNFVPREVTFVARGGTPAVADGAAVERGAPVARGVRVALGLEGEDAAGLDPAAFALAHDWAPVPAAEPELALVSHAAHELRLYRRGEETGRFQVGFGQSGGAKTRRGDNRTPKGVYFVADKSRGPFGGPAADVFGGYWMRINYPNGFDAARAVAEGQLTPEAARSITRAWRARRETDKHTALGGGIGLHGWAWEWDDDASRAMSWGCVVMHLRDADTIYGALDSGAMVLLF